MTNINKNIMLIVFFMITLLVLFVNKLLTPRTLSPSELLVNGLYLFEEPKEISDFKFLTSNKKTFTKSDLLNKWTLIYFGFKNCPDECPTTMHELGKLYEVLDSKGFNLSNKQWVLVTIDPERDGPEEIDFYAKGFNKNFIGLSASRPMLLNLATQLSVNNIMPKKNVSNHDHLNNHVNNIILINPDAKFAGIFRPPFEVSRLSLTYQSVTN